MMPYSGKESTSMVFTGTLFVLMSLSAVVSAQNSAFAGNCSETADVIFVIDSSVSVREACPLLSGGSAGGGAQPQVQDNWLLILDYVSQVVKTMPIGQNRTRIGVFTFSNAVDYDHVIPLDAYNDTTALATRISSLPYIGRNTNMTGAMRHVGRMFSDARARDDVTALSSSSVATARQQIAVLLTDGINNVDADPIQESRRLKQDGVALIVVGVSDYVDDAELREIASPPADYSFLHAEDFGHLNLLVSDTLNQLNRLVCNDPITLPCRDSTMDVAFLLDSSGSIGPKNDTSHDGGINWKLMTNFVVSMIQKLNVSPQDTRIALIRFSFVADVIFNFTTSAPNAVEDILRMQYIGSQTNTSGALDVMLQVFSPGYGARSNVKKVGIVITDGQSDTPIATNIAAKKAKDAGIEMFAIGLTDLIVEAELKSIASNPVDTHYYNRPTYALVGTVTSQLLWSVCHSACNSIAATSPMPPSGGSSSSVDGQQPCSNVSTICASGERQTWQPYPGHLLLGLSYATLNNVDSVGVCQAQCLQDVACRSVQYIATIQSCRISYYTKDMAPAGSFKTDSAVDYFERVCKPV